MSAIHVCPLSALDTTLTTHNPKWMISLSGPGKSLARPSQISAGFLALEFNDISEERDGLIAPARHHIEALLEFGEKWSQAGPLLIHCWMGISRSTAAALILSAQSDPFQNMGALAQRLRRLSPMATPNPLMISLADEALGQNGKLVEAVKQIGRGETAYEGQPFSLTISA